MTFEDQVAQLTREQRASSPVALAKLSLAPIRKAAEDGLAAYRALCDELHPQISNAYVRASSAARARVHSRPLDEAIDGANRLMAGGANNFTSLVERIDSLTEWDAGQIMVMKNFPGMLASAQSSAGALRGLALQVAAHLMALESRVAEAVVPQPAPLTGPMGGFDLVDAMNEPASDGHPRPDL